MLVFAGQEVEGDEAALGFLRFIERGGEAISRFAVGIGFCRLGRLRGMLDICRGGRWLGCGLLGRGGRGRLLRFRGLLVAGTGLLGSIGELYARAEAAAGKKPTARNEMGPFYRRGAPSRALLRSDDDPGLPLIVEGAVFDARGERRPDATIEVWQANHHGKYDLDGYRYRALLRADDRGVYRFDSVMPGHYPDRVAQHIHYLVKAPGCRPLITQLYFATDPAFEGDPDHKFTNDPLVLSRELVCPVLLAGDPGQLVARVTFELCLERL